MLVSISETQAEALFSARIGVKVKARPALPRRFWSIGRGVLGSVDLGNDGLTLLFWEDAGGHLATLDAEEVRLRFAA